MPNMYYSGGGQNEYGEYGSDWDEDMYDPGFLEKWGSEMGGAGGGAVSGGLTGASVGFMASGGNPIGGAIGGAVGFVGGGIMGWLSGRDNAQQQAMAKQKYIQDAMLTDAKLIASGRKTTAAVRAATMKFANMRQQLRASVFSNPNLTQKQKWAKFNELDASVQSKGIQAIAKLQGMAEESGRAQVAAINNMQFAQAHREMQASRRRADKFLNASMSVAETALTLAVKTKEKSGGDDWGEEEEEGGDEGEDKEVSLDGGSVGGSSSSLTLRDEEAPLGGEEQPISFGQDFQAQGLRGPQLGPQDPRLMDDNMVLKFFGDFFGEEESIKEKLKRRYWDDPNWDSALGKLSTNEEISSAGDAVSEWVESTED